MNAQQGLQSGLCDREPVADATWEQKGAKGQTRATYCSPLPLGSRRGF
jgi:hypothetical protein